jgi:hypothetical protein
VISGQIKNYNNFGIHPMHFMEQWLWEWHCGVLLSVLWRNSTNKIGRKTLYYGLGILFFSFQQLVQHLPIIHSFLLLFRFIGGLGVGHPP